jgi:hypothetical protein
MALGTVSNITGIKTAACNTKTSGVIGGEALDSNLRAQLPWMMLCGIGCFQLVRRWTWFEGLQA